MEEKCLICGSDGCKCVLPTIETSLGVLKIKKKKKKKRNHNTIKFKKWRTRVDYKNALKEWSKQVQERDGHKCIICQGNEYIQSHHLLAKNRYKELSLDINCGVSLDPKCHKFSKYAAHTNPIWFSDWLQKNRPDQYNWCLERLKPIEGV
jgi:hypothetical protein